MPDPASGRTSAPSSDLGEARPDLSGAQLGERLRALRKAKGWTLQQLAGRSGVSLSTLSKIENAQVAPTFDTLVKAARGLGLGFEALLAPPIPAGAPSASEAERRGGRMTVTRRDEAVGFSSAMYDYRVHASGLRRKYMTPLIMAVKARRPEDVTAWSSHEGEEFVFVLTGSVRLHTDSYEPVTLHAGDSAYIDSGMAHMFLNVGEGEATMASICYSDALDGPDLMTGVAPAEPADV
jgi:transcriptional regulator with XRE-family HTH domain